jgi:hypothetical protein
MHAPAPVKLSLAQVRLAPGPGHAQNRQRPERVELGEDERGLEVLGGLVHRLINSAGVQHLAERIHRPAMIHDAPVGILLAHLHQLAPLTLCGWTRLLIARFQADDRTAGWPR